MTSQELLISIGEMLEAKISPLREDIRELRLDMSDVKQDISGLKQEMGSMRSEIGSMREEMGGVKQRLTRIETTLENETNRGIRIIAEGHLDLSRKLDDALKVDNEKELLLLRVTHLENEVHIIKERMAL
ncbi:DUF2746 domain-containing protein [Faecalicatena contorta]|uniref:DUF2746 domain-containing protein n=2 Tax=Clostridia TaxID=186801 RepID=UPI0011071610|nr:DUF2746 domain-containing protein [Faecalicatena contorta]MBM6685682.1 DUF2746 domain-containing protein [Faecalicatena contorta]MBM6711277.1 DUF2746 domain-containing protein [Faecalicatena contorta]